MNIPTIIVALLVASAFVGVIANAVHNRKNGKSNLCSCSGSYSCGGSCGCGDCGCTSGEK